MMFVAIFMPHMYFGATAQPALLLVLATETEYERPMDMQCIKVRKVCIIHFVLEILKKYDVLFHFGDLSSFQKAILHNSI